MLLGQMSHADHHWHATNECFNCFNCKTQLLGKPFLPRKGAVYCSIDCSRIHSIDTKEGNKRKAHGRSPSVDLELVNVARNKFFPVVFKNKYTIEKSPKV